MQQFTDQLGRIIELNKQPKRIVSLVPSQTELLYDLGLENEVVGITKFCVHPEKWFRTKMRVGGTKQLHINKIKELQPDLIIANKEENVQEQVEELAKNFAVWTSDLNDLKSALVMIASIGELTGKQQKAKEIFDAIGKRFTSLKLETKNPKFRTCYLIWKEPYMSVGGDTFINDMLKHAGFENIFSNKTRYPEVTISELNTENCELLLLSSEPFPFKQKHIDELQSLLPDTKIILVDGEMFSWYGSRLLQAPSYFQHLRQQIAANA